MAEETGRLLNQAINDGVARGLGLGQAVAEYLQSTNPPHARTSVVAAAARLQIPLTIHVAIGTDIIHMHPDASGAAIGEGSLRDFRYFVSNVARLEQGVYLNCGSAVILPEVFLKAVALARNQGRPLDGLTTVNLDFMRAATARRRTWSPARWPASAPAIRWWAITRFSFRSWRRRSWKQ